MNAIKKYTIDISPQSKLVGEKLPSNAEVLSVLKYFLRSGQTIHESAS